MMTLSITFLIVSFILGLIGAFTLDWSGTNSNVGKFLCVSAVLLFLMFFLTFWIKAT